MCGMKHHINLSVRRFLFVLLLCMSIIALLSVVLFSRAMFHHMGETAFPVVVSEAFWVCAWLLLAELGIALVVTALYWVGVKFHFGFVRDGE